MVAGVMEAKRNMWIVGIHDTPDAERRGGKDSIPTSSLLVLS